MNWKVVSAILVIVIIALSGLITYMVVYRPATNTKLTQISFQLPFQPGGRDVPYYAAIDQGYFAQEGLAVSIIAGTGSTGTASNVASGTVNLGYIEYPTLVTSIASGLPIKAVFLYETQYPTGVASFQPIPDLTSIEGKTFGFSPGNGVAIMLHAVMDENGANWSAVKTVDVAASAQVSSFLAGKFDIVPAGFDSTLPVIQAGAHGKQVYTLSLYTYAPVLGEAIIASNSMIQQNPTIISEFIKATIKGVQYSINNPQSAVASFVKYNSAANSTLILQGWENAVQFMEVNSYATNNYGMFNSTQVASSVTFVTHAFNTSTVDPSSVYTNTYVPTGQVLPKPSS